jgi:hypothetical protein
MGELGRVESRQVIGQRELGELGRVERVGLRELGELGRELGELGTLFFSHCSLLARSAGMGGAGAGELGVRKSGEGDV